MAELSHYKLTHCLYIKLRVLTTSGLNATYVCNVHELFKAWPGIPQVSLLTFCMPVR